MTDGASTPTGLAALAIGEGRTSVLVCPLTVYRSTPTSVGHDLLTALGRDVLRPQRARDVLRTAVAWLVAEGIEAVVFEFVELLDAELWPDLLGTLRHAGVSGWWRLGFAISTDHRRVWEAAGAVAVDEQHLARTLKARWKPAYRDALVGEPPFPLVPECDFPTFLAETRRLLAPEDYARAKVEYDVGSDRLRESWATQRRVVNHETLYDVLRSLVADQPGPAAACRLRGAAAACFMDGDHLLHVDLDAFFANAGALASPFDDETQNRLCRIASPQTAAVGGLCTALRVTLRDLRGMRVGDVDGAELIRLDGDDHEIPETAAVPLRAQVHQRRASGAADDGPLFVTSSGKKLERFDHEARYLAEGVGIRVALSASGRERSGTRGESASTWARRTGIALKPLDQGSHSA